MSKPNTLVSTKDDTHVIKTDPTKNLDNTPYILEGDDLTGDQIDAIYNEITNIPVAVMREADFVNYYLRPLAGLEPNSGNRVFDFYKGAGGYNFPVDIADSKGEIIFRVPPMASTQHIDPLIKDDNAPGIAAIQEAVGLLTHVNPFNAKKQIRAMIANRVTNLHKKGFKYVKGEATWLEIFERYNLTDEVLALHGNAISEQAKKNLAKKEEAKSSSGKPDDGTGSIENFGDGLIGEF